MPESILEEISKIRTGDRDAVAWLYDTFAPRLLRRLGARFGSMRGLDRDDLLQDTFVYLLGKNGRVLDRFVDRSVDDGATPESLERFLWSAACGIASNRRRSLLRHPKAEIDKVTLQIPGGEPPAVAKDALERLADCLRRGGDRAHLYFQLRYLDGHKPSEIAEITGWSKRSTYKLKQTLDEALERCVEELELVRP